VETLGHPAADAQAGREGPPRWVSAAANAAVSGLSQTHAGRIPRPEMLAKGFFALLTGSPLVFVAELGWACRELRRKSFRIGNRPITPRRAKVMRTQVRRTLTSDRIINWLLCAILLYTPNPLVVMVFGILRSPYLDRSLVGADCHIVPSVPEPVAVRRGELGFVVDYPLDFL